MDHSCSCLNSCECDFIYLFILVGGKVFDDELRMLSSKTMIAIFRLIIWVGLKWKGNYVFKRKAEGDLIQKRRHRHREGQVKAREFSLYSLWREYSPANTYILNFRPPELWENKFLVFLLFFLSHQICGNLLQQPQEINTLPMLYALVGFDFMFCYYAYYYI